jgi:hypothetical protein
MRLFALIGFVLVLLAATVRGQTDDVASKWVVQGCVVDRSNDDRVLFASVVVGMDTVSAGADGCFRIALGSDPRMTRSFLSIHYAGFEPYEKRINSRDLKDGRMHKLRRKPVSPYAPMKRSPR